MLLLLLLMLTHSPPRQTLRLFFASAMTTLDPTHNVALTNQRETKLFTTRRGMLPLHTSGLIACTYHIFYNSPELISLVAMQVPRHHCWRGCYNSQQALRTLNAWLLECNTSLYQAGFTCLSLLSCFGGFCLVRLCSISWHPRSAVAEKLLVCRFLRRLSVLFHVRFCVRVSNLWWRFPPNESVAKTTK